MSWLLTLIWTSCAFAFFSPAPAASIRSYGHTFHGARTPPAVLRESGNVGVSGVSRNPRLAALERKAKPVLVPALGYAGLAGSALGAQRFVQASAGAATLAGIPLPMATLAAIAAPALWLLGEFIFLGGGQHVATMMGGQPADATLTRLCASVADRAGLPPPAHVYEIPTPELNAFAAGFGSGGATVAVTSGIRRALTDRELEAVIAHEIGHIRHSDMRTNMHVAVAIAGLGGLYEMGNMLLRSERDGDDKDEEGSMAGLGLALMVGGAAARVVAQLLQLSMSRGAEYEADLVAAELCGADSMISALKKIERSAVRVPRDRLAARGDAFAHAYISNGPSDTSSKMYGKEKEGLHATWAQFERFFSTHPTTNDRIEALRAQRGAADKQRTCPGKSSSPSVPPDFEPYVPYSNERF